MSELDLNLLYVLVALDDCRSVSDTAIKLHRSQPAVSAALGKLRGFFDDPLFVRIGNTMQPTPRGRGIVESARGILRSVGTDIIAAPVFDPATLTGPISLAMSDVGEIVFLPKLLKDLRRLAPQASINAVSLPAAQIAEGLEAGTVDLAMGYFPDLKKNNFFQQVLFTDGFVGLIRADHPMAAKKLSLKQFLQLEHAVVRAESRSEEVIEGYLKRKRIQRRVVLTTPHFGSAPVLVAQSDLMVTVPEPLAYYFSAASPQVRVVGLPFPSPRIPLRQFWHRKFHHDPRSRWLRMVTAELFQTRS
ncbi:LysR family transcriptional regulator [Steroidobacter flavus]|uniref:LysR family transcriptional regulator n=1 Tax=Steroidobacter flavus TaxID=1842136 RepID=A0ABV8SY17_9GAMM